MVFANVIGSVVNVVISQGVIMIVLMTIIVAGIVVNIKNAIKKFRQENHQLQKPQAQTLLNSSHDNNPTQRPPDDVKSVNLFEKILDKSASSLEVIRENTKKHNPSVDQEKLEVKYIQNYEGSNLHPKKTLIFVLTIVLTIVYSLLKGTSSINSIVNLEKCQWEQLPMFAVFVVAIAIIQAYSIKLVKREQYLKVKYDLHSDHEVKFTNKKIAFLICFALVVGFVANLLGLGGGFVIFPMLVLIEVSPLVASATTIYMIFLSKIVAALLALFSVYIKFDYTVAECVLVAVFVLLSSKLSDWILKK